VIASDFGCPWATTAARLGAERMLSMCATVPRNPGLYYTLGFGIPETQFDPGMMSPDDPQACLLEVWKYEGRPRTWFVFSHVHSAEADAGSEKALLLGRLRCLGSEIDEFEARGARARLFDLTQPTPACRTR